MNYKGVNYDVGISPLGQERPSRPIFDPAIVRREIVIIRDDLHCNAIRIVGHDLQRMAFAAECALELGLCVWLSPAAHDATPRQTLRYLAEAARVAQRLGRKTGAVVLVVGWELTFFMSGLVMGRTSVDRMQVFMKPSRLLLNTFIKGPFNWRLNRFLKRAIRLVRTQFNGPVTYAAGRWEDVDWDPFDFVAIDCYRDAGNKASFDVDVRRYFHARKPVVIAEFGCCTYRGAGEKGAHGWPIVDWDATPPRLRGNFVRDEQEQARYLLELLEIFEAAGAEGAFAFTFVAPKYPYSDDPATDLDMASYALVRSGSDARLACGRRYPDMPWEPKAAFDAIAGHFQR